MALSGPQATKLDKQMDLGKTLKDMAHQLGTIRKCPHFPKTGMHVDAPAPIETGNTRIQYVRVK